MYLTLADQTAFRLDIQLTEDGKKYTNAVTYFVFDDRCHYCNVLLAACFERVGGVVLTWWRASSLTKGFLFRYYKFLANINVIACVWTRVNI